MAEVKRPEDSAGGYLHDAGRVYAINEATKIARKWAVAAGILSVVLAYSGESRIGLLIGVLVAFATFRVVRYVMCKRMDIGGVPLILDLLPESWRRPSQRREPTRAELDAILEKYPRSAHVPVVPELPALTPAAVLNSPLISSRVITGGLAGTRVERLRSGVLKITRGGFAFLPNAQNALEARLGENEAAVAMKLAGDAFGIIGAVEKLKDVADVLEESPTLSEWEDEALKQVDAFVIPWTRLVGVIVGSDRTVFERTRDDGGTDSFSAGEPSLDLPTVFMTMRLDHELVTIMRDRIYQPKLDEFLSEQRATLPKDTEPAVVLETARNRVSDWIAANESSVESALRTAMAPALAGYRKLPVLVKQKPWLFI